MSVTQDMRDAMDAFFVKVKTIPAGVANKLNGKTPEEIANAMTKTDIGLNNVSNKEQATESQAKGMSVQTVYMSAQNIAQAGDETIQFLKNYHAGKPPLRGDNSSAQYYGAAFSPLVLDFAIVTDNTEEFNARTHIEANGKGAYVDTRDMSYFSYNGSTWTDLGVNSATSRLTKNSLLLSPYDGKTYFIDQNGSITALYD